MDRYATCWSKRRSTIVVDQESASLCENGVPINPKSYGRSVGKRKSDCTGDGALTARGKPGNKAIVAVARELAGFVWAIGKEVSVE